MNIIGKLLIRTLAVLITAYLLPGVELEGLWTALVVVVVLGLFNILVKPIIIVLTLPVNILTLGLFTLVINGLLVLLTSLMVKGFMVDSLWTGLLFSLLLTIINWFLNSLKYS